MTARTIHGAPIPLHLTRGLLENPPIPCAFKIEDRVRCTNDYGATYDAEVIGFAPKNHLLFRLGNFVHLNGSAWWFPVKPDRLQLLNSIPVTDLV